MMIPVQRPSLSKGMRNRLACSNFTAVTESNIHHPTGAGLLQDGVRVITRLVKKVKEVACHAVQGFENRNADIKEKILSIAKVLRRRTRESWEEVDRITKSNLGILTLKGVSV